MTDAQQQPLNQKRLKRRELLVSALENLTSSRLENVKDDISVLQFPVDASLAAIRKIQRDIVRGKDFLDNFIHLMKYLELLCSDPEKRSNLKETPSELPFGEYLSVVRTALCQSIERVCHHVRELDATSAYTITNGLKLILQVKNLTPADKSLLVRSMHHVSPEQAQSWILSATARFKQNHRSYLDGKTILERALPELPISPVTIIATAELELAPWPIQSSQERNLFNALLTLLDRKPACESFTGKHCATWLMQVPHRIAERTLLRSVVNVATLAFGDEFINKLHDQVWQQKHTSLSRNIPKLSPTQIAINNAANSIGVREELLRKLGNGTAPRRATM